MLPVRPRIGRHSIETVTASLRFAVIGAGRLGASLALALQSAGASLVGFTSRSPEGRARAEGWLGRPAAPDVSALVGLSPDVYFVSVPDRALLEVADELGEALRAAVRDDFDGPTGGRPVVAHTSGATSVDVLDPCRRAGAETLVFHPLQTFSDPLSGQSRFAGAAIAITAADGDDSPAASLGLLAAGMLGARAFPLADGKRSLYHAAASVACNYFVTLEHHARDLFVRAGLPAEDAFSTFLPLVRATLENIEAQGAVSALTGPISRGDVETVAGHLEALRADAPHLLPMYRALGSATLALVRARADVEAALVDALAALLGVPGEAATPPHEPAKT